MREAQQWVIKLGTWEFLAGFPPRTINTLQLQLTYVLSSVRCDPKRMSHTMTMRTFSLTAWRNTQGGTEPQLPRKTLPRKWRRPKALSPSPPWTSRSTRSFTSSRSALV